MHYLPALIGVLALLASYMLGYTPLLIFVIYIILSLITFLVYAKDKSAAKSERRRVAESTLHLFSLFGGWPGAVVAQQYLRHKTKKLSFRISFWVTVIANGIFFICLHTSQGAIYLNTCIFWLEDFLINNMSSGDALTILLNLLGFHS